MLNSKSAFLAGCIISLNLMFPWWTVAQDVGDYWLGIACRPISDATRINMGLSRGEGLLVYSVAKNGPAQKAGLKLYDILLAVDGRAVGAKLPMEAAYRGTKEEVRLEIRRTGAKKSITVQPAKRADSEVLIENETDAPPAHGIQHPFLRQVRLELKPLSEDSLKRLPSPYEGGIEVVNHSGDYASISGIKKGDIIVAVDTWQIRNLMDLQYVLETQKAFDKFFLIRPDESGGQLLHGAMLSGGGSSQGENRMQVIVDQLQQERRDMIITLTELEMAMASARITMTEFPTIDMEILAIDKDSQNVNDRSKLEAAQRKLTNAQTERERAAEKFKQIGSRMKEFESELQSIEAQLEVAKRRLAQWNAESKQP